MPAAVRALPPAVDVRLVVRLVWTKPTIWVGLLMANVEVEPVVGFVAGVAEIRAMICPGVPEPPGAGIVAFARTLVTR